MDLSFILRGDNSTADLLVQDGDLYIGDDLQTSVTLSLFSNARDTEGGFNSNDISKNQGWAGDIFYSSPLGSLLWKYNRSKSTQATLELVKAACQKSLQWMIDDKIASSIDIKVWWGEDPKERININIIIHRPSGESENILYAFAWNQL